jgi:hypothetical protein
MHFASISQTIDSSHQILPTTNSGLPLTIQDTSVTISKSQATKIVLDLEYLRLILKQDSILKIDTARYSYISSQKDSSLAVLQNENATLSIVITNQTSQAALLNDVINKTKKQTFWIKVERDAAVIALIFVGGYAALK